MPGASAMLRLQSDLRAISTDPPGERGVNDNLIDTNHVLLHMLLHAYEAACRGRERFAWLLTDASHTHAHTPSADGCSASPNESDLFVWTASVFGPSDSPWVRVLQI